MLARRTVGAEAQEPEPEILVNGATLKNVFLYKYLGVSLNNIPSFDQATNEADLKANKKIVPL